MKPGTDCPFCAKNHDPDAEYLGNGVNTFIPLNPVTDGHRLFVPMDHVEWGDKTEPGLLAACFAAASHWAYDHRIGSFNIITSRGEPATQSIAHVHVHLVPRTEGDGLHLPWTGQER